MDTVQNRPRSRLDHLVSRLEQDIRQRGLLAGDRYLTASQAGELLGVSTATADRAMQRLSKRRMLLRRPNLGTFVGPHFEMRRGTMIRTVYVLVPPVRLGGDGDRLEAFASGIRSQLSDTNITLCSLPRGDVLAYVQELLQSAFSAGKVSGFVPISCPREVYRQLSDSGAPTVMFGTPYGDEQYIPSVDVDNRMAGQLLTGHLTNCGHRRMALLVAVEGRPGDHCFHDGVSEALTAAGLPHNSLTLRIVPPDLAAVTGELDNLLSMSDEPTAVIVRTLDMARVVAAALDRLQQPAARICEIVCQNQPVTKLDQVLFTCVQPRVSLCGMAARIGEMLDQLGRGEALEEPHVVIPVGLCPRSSS